jgi:hypothetical protein
LGTGALVAAGGLVAASAGAGAAAGYGIGKLTIDPRLKDKNQDLVQLSQASRGSEHALASGDKGAMREARKQLFAQLTKSKENSGGVVDTVFGGAARLFGAEDPNAKGQARAQEQLAKLDAALKDNSKHTEMAGRSARKAAGDLDTFGRSVDRVAKKLNKIGGGDGNNGLPPPPANGQ